ncbi:MAG: hypothetical protein JST19_08610 [Bacteroidetes bacterium]|nr:hypothetical protein [Bacteroidota bacterium]
MTDFRPTENPPTRLVKRCEELLSIPLNEYSVEDLRLMIGQEFCLEYLIPLAIEKLKIDLFAEGDFYPGDLLKNVLNTRSEFWGQNPLLYKEVADLIWSRRNRISSLGISLGQFGNDI